MPALKWPYRIGTRVRVLASTDFLLDRSCYSIGDLGTVVGGDHDFHLIRVVFDRDHDEWFVDSNDVEAVTTKLVKNKLGNFPRKKEGVEL